MKYKVHLYFSTFRTFDVEAENHGEAIAKAESLDVESNADARAEELRDNIEYHGEAHTMPEIPQRR